MKKTFFALAVAVLAMGTDLSASMGGETNAVVKTSDVVVKGISSFCKAIMEGDVATVKRMIDLGEDVNQKSLGMTPAIFAARYNKAEILKVLIKNGANLDRTCDKGWSIEKHAKLSNAQEVLDILRENS